MENTILNIKMTNSYHESRHMTICGIEFMPTSGQVALILLVLIFVGTYFRGDRNDRIWLIYIFADSPSKCCKNPQNCLKMTEFSKITFLRVQIFANFVRYHEIREN